MERKEYQRLPDQNIDGVAITQIYRHAEYYYRTSGYNYTFIFRCDLSDENEVYNLCKKAFPEGKNHIKDDGSIGTYAVDHDFVRKISLKRQEEREFSEKGCNWVYLVREGNDD